MAASMYNVYVGSETGLFKGINTVKGVWDNLNSIKTPDKAKEIRTINWIDDDEGEIIIGLKDKSVSIYNVQTKTLSETLSLDGGKGNLRNVVKIGEKYITAIDSGIVNIWEDEESVAEINTGDNLHCLTSNRLDSSMFGTGGKENELKLWDVTNTEKPTFVSKNVRHDWLELRVPVWVTGIDFLDGNKIVTSTGHHQVRVYDPKVQRRPVVDMTFDEYPLTAMSLYRDNQIIVGNTHGKMALLDIRKGKLVHIFKGFAGSIRSVMCHPKKPIVASCGLDRCLRLHDIDTRELVHKIYLKSRLNCVLLSKKAISENQDKDKVVYRKRKNDAECDLQSDNGSGDEDNEDDVWDNMEVVQTRTVKKTELEKTNDNSTDGMKEKGMKAKKKDAKKKRSL